MITYTLADHFHLHRFGQNETVGLSFQQSPSNGAACLVCIRVHQLREELLKCLMTRLGMVPTLCSPNISCIKPCYFVWYSISVTAVWGGRKWCRRHFRRHGKCWQWSGIREFLTHVPEDGSALIFKDNQLDEFSRSLYSTAMPGFSSVWNWKIDLEIWSILTFTMIVGIPFFNVRGKNAPSLL